MSAENADSVVELRADTGGAIYLWCKRCGDVVGELGQRVDPQTACTAAAEHQLADREAGNG